MNEPHSADYDALLEDLDTVAMHVEQAREAVDEGRDDALRAALDDLATVANRCVIPSEKTDDAPG